MSLGVRDLCAGRAWEKHTKQQQVDTAEAAAASAHAALPEVVAAAEAAAEALDEALAAEAPLAETATMLEQEKITALETASRIDLEAKGADMTAKKAEAVAVCAAHATTLHVPRDDGWCCK